MLDKKKRFKTDRFGRVREVHKEIIFDTLQRVIDKEKLFDFKEKKADIGLNSRWQEIVGKNLGSQTTVKASKTGILTIEAKSNVVVQEVKMMQFEIIQKFKSGEPPIVFKKITVKMKS